MFFDWDEGNVEKCGKHGVGIAEIEYALLSDPYITEDSYVGEPRLRAVGENGSGRYVFVVFTLRKTEFGTKVRPISARYMHKKEVDRFLNNA